MDSFSLEDCLCRENHDKVMNLRKVLDSEALLINLLKKLYYTPNQVGRIMSLYKGDYDIAFNNIMTGVGDERLWLYHSRLNSYMSRINSYDQQVDEFSMLSATGAKLSFSRQELFDMTHNYFYDYVFFNENHCVGFITKFLNGDPSMDEYVPEKLRIQDEFLALLDPLNQPEYFSSDEEMEEGYDYLDLLGIKRDVPVGEKYEFPDCIEYVGVGIEPVVKEVIDAYPTYEHNIVKYVDDLPSVALVSRKFYSAASQESAERFKTADFKVSLKVVNQGNSYLMRTGKQVRSDIFKRRTLSYCADHVYVKRGGYKKTNYVRRFSLYLEYAWYNVTVERDNINKIVAVESVTDAPRYMQRSAAGYKIHNMGQMIAMLMPMDGLFYSLGNYEIEGGPSCKKLLTYNGLGRHTRLKSASFEFMMKYQELVDNYRAADSTHQIAMRFMKILVYSGI